MAKRRGRGGGVTVSKYGTISWTILFRDGLTPDKFKTKKVTAWLIHRLSTLAICMLASYYNNYYTSNLFRIIEGSVAIQHLVNSPCSANSYQGMPSARIILYVHTQLQTVTT